MCGFGARLRSTAAPDIRSELAVSPGAVLHENRCIRREDLNVLENVLPERLEDAADIAASKKSLANPERIPWSEVKRQLGL